jgi:hypothetical protein
MEIINVWTVKRFCNRNSVFCVLGMGNTISQSCDINTYFSPSGLTYNPATFCISFNRKGLSVCYKIKSYVNYCLYKCILSPFSGNNYCVDKIFQDTIINWFQNSFFMLFKNNSCNFWANKEATFTCNHCHMYIFHYSLFYIFKNIL